MTATILKITEQGWYVETSNGKSVGPFRYLNQIDPANIASKLGVHPQEVFKAKLRVEAYQTNLQKVAEIIEFEGVTVQPLFKGISRKVHPAIGVIDGRAYMGVSLPCLVTVQKKRKRKRKSTEEDEGLQTEEKEMPFLITSTREKILLHKEVLKQLRWRVMYKPAYFENRWSLESINAFLNGATVDPLEVYQDVKNAWQTYIEFQNADLYDFLTLWSIGTYFFHLFKAYPYVYFGGIKRSGKTKALTIASLICFNAVFSCNISTAALFRLIQSGRCTVLMDETEGLNNPERKQDFRSLLLSGFKKGALVYRTEKTNKERLVPEAFEVYSPKMIANIRGIEDVLEDRCIVIIMRRGKNRAIINIEPDVDDPIWQKIRDQLHIFYLTNWEKVQSIYLDFGEVSEVSEEVNILKTKENNLTARDWELWKPILTLAKFFDVFLRNFTSSQTTQTSLFERMLALAFKKTREKQTENMTETGDYILVETLLKLVKEDGYYKVKDIRSRMAEKFDEEQKWLDTRWVGRALKRLGFTDKRRLGTGIEYRLTVKGIKDLAERMGLTTEEDVTEETKEKLDSSFDFNSILGCFLIPSYVGTCDKCKREGVTLTRSVSLRNSSKLNVCEECGREVQAWLQMRDET